MNDEYYIHTIAIAYNAVFNQYYMSGPAEAVGLLGL